MQLQICVERRLSGLGYKPPIQSSRTIPGRLDAPPDTRPNRRVDDTVSKKDMNGLRYLEGPSSHSHLGCER